MSSIHRVYVYRVKSKETVRNRNSKRIPVERFIKIGVTSQQRIKDRFEKYPDGMVDHYSISLLTSQTFNTRREAEYVEKQIHLALKDLSYRPKHWFSGYTECYRSNGNARSIIKSVIWAARLKFAPDTKVVRNLSKSTINKANLAAERFK